ncbi:hypothetical protein TNCV_3167851 [Trichonephila clavipes]|uniref:Uncharacterized protein n=1 Tax=Trichonephila clavipes TaxID=2585209 RepID=A0A8X6REW5_TRICX|nr:hypothetical protein TNCV_3167851 [Trichonephila clavipes]
MRTTNHHRTGDGKPRLVGVNFDNSSSRNDDDPNEPGIWNAVEGLKKPVHMQIPHFSGSCTRKYRPLYPRMCGSSMTVVRNQLHAIYLRGIWQTYCFASTLPGS